MLQRFLLVGVGGSGGKTLRLVRQNLLWTLEKAGYTGPFPDGWQFVQLDVPVVPDGTEPGLPEQLPPGSYVGLAAKGLSFKSIDRMLESKGPLALEHAAGWKPPQDEVGVPPSFGAGQYRGVGRVVAAAAMQSLVDRLRQAVQTLTGVDVSAELEEVSRKLDVPLLGDSLPPAVIVVSSMAGGAGAGFFIDVCDVLRMLGQAESQAILYTPDVFQDLPPAAKAGVNPNALAVISELLAGAWNNQPPTGEEFAFLTAAGLPLTPIDRRGPRYPLLVGRANDSIAFTSQNDVYRAVGKCLATWMTSAQVQVSARSYFQGNFVTAANYLEDRLPLAPDKPRPMSSLGYASVGLGRDRFLRYSTQRLARRTVEHFLRAHWNERVPEEQTPEAARDQMADENLFAFLNECGLRELGPEHNQILDAIRGGPALEARVPALREMKQKLSNAVVSQGPKLEGARIPRQIEVQLEERKHAFLAEQLGDDRKRAERWSVEIQDALQRRVALRLGQMGGPVTMTLLDHASRELTESVIPDLQQEMLGHQKSVTTTHMRINSVFSNFQGELIQDNPLIGQAAKEATDSLWAEAEIALLELTIELIKDLASNVIKPLRSAVARSVEKLTRQFEDEPGKPSIVKLWPERDFVPTALAPAENEVLLEEVDTYPETFNKKISATTGVVDELSALALATREIISGTFGTSEEQRAVHRLQAWVPKAHALSVASPPAEAKFEVVADVDVLESRARDWLKAPDTAISEFIRQSLTDYLDPDKSGPSEHEDRKAAFRAGFNQALNISLPLAKIDPAVLDRVHGSQKPEYHRIMTVVPFPTGTPGRRIVTEALVDRAMDPTAVEKVFGDGSQSEIEISTFLAAPKQPVVFSSLMGPIAGEWVKRSSEGEQLSFWKWRRARPLSHFIPTSPEVRLAMIRGWFMSRILGWIDIKDFGHSPTQVYSPGDGWLRFPYPLLGPGVNKLQDLLPAILESIPLALVELSQGNDSFLGAYERLAEFGDVGDKEARHGKLSKEFLDWVNRGEVPPGASRPDEADAGRADMSPKERIDVVLEFLEKYIQAFSKLDEEEVSYEKLHRLSRSWELRKDIVQALRDIKELCELERAAGEVQFG